MKAGWTLSRLALLVVLCLGAARAEDAPPGPRRVNLLGVRMAAVKPPRGIERHASCFQMCDAGSWLARLFGVERTRSARQGSGRSLCGTSTGGITSRIAAAPGNL